MEVWGSLPKEAGPEAVRGGPLVEDVPLGAARLYERMSAKFGEDVGPIFEEVLGWVPREAKKGKAKPSAGQKAKDEGGEANGDGGEAARPLPTAAD